jgi:RND family efflux transporter MFP subunit
MTGTNRQVARGWVGWSIVGLLALGIALTFVIRSDEGGAKKPPSGPRVTPVAAVAVVRGDLVERVKYPGELDADAADVASFFPGRLESVEVRVGDRVDKGHVLARLDPVDLEEQVAQANAQVKAAEADERRAQVDVTQARRELARFEALLADKLVSPSEVEVSRSRVEALRMQVGSASAQAAEAKARVALLEKRLAESVVVAPFAGRVAERYMDPGAIVGAGTRLVRLAAESPLWVRFEVPEHDVALVKVGAKVSVGTRAHGEEVMAEVRGLAGEVARDRRVAVAEAVIERPAEGWLPGMFAEAHVAVRTVARGLIVPEVAVLSRLVGAVLESGVFVADEGHARWVKVEVLARDGGRVAVTPAAEAVRDAEVAGAGRYLVEGAQVLTAGHIDLNEGAAIKVSPPAEAR